MYQLGSDDLEIQARARLFVDELIPWEVEAEMNGGVLPPEVLEQQRSRVHDRSASTPPTCPPSSAVAATRCSSRCSSRSRSDGPPTPWRGSPTPPPSWFPPVATAYQTERWIRPTVRGEMQECYAITEEGAGSDVDAIEATARRDGDSYVLDGVKWHVTSYNDAAYAFFQAKLTDGPHAGEHAMFIVDLPTEGVRVVRTPAYTHTISHHHPIVAFEGVRVPASTWWAPKAVGWPSPTNGSATSG